MTRWRVWVIVLALVTAGCATDGGPVGTGISTSSAVSGNVFAVQTNTNDSGVGSAPSTLPPIRVSIDGLNVATMTDSRGNFELNGRFAGTLTLRFTVPQYQVTQSLDVPAGSALVLQNIELEPDGVVVQAVDALDFFGTVDMVDCTDDILLVHGRDRRDMQFLIHLDERTTFIDASGRMQTCTGIRAGHNVIIEGTVAYATDRTVSALVVRIAPRPPSPRQVVAEVPFAGTLAALDCNDDAGFLVIDDSMHRTSLEITPRTDISDGTGAISCENLQLGQVLRGRGQINLRMPGVVVGTVIAVIGSPNEIQSLRFVGYVNSIDCAAGRLQLADVTNTIDVRLLPTTVITADSGQLLMCTDIEVGNRIVGLGQVATDGTSVLDAVRVTIKHGHPHGGRPQP